MTEKANLREKFLELERAVQSSFIERQEEARGLSLAALSGHHIFFLGPPGTAKSMMIRFYCDAFNASFFQWLLTRFSTPEELFGPVDLAGLKAGTFRRITTGKAPEANVAFLDEVFKGNSAILNTLLSWLQERIFHNDGTPMKCPLIFASAASNELPEIDEGLSALYDRFLIRFNIDYIKGRDNFQTLLNTGSKPNITVPQITRQELEQARQEVAALPLTQELVDALADLREHLRHEKLVVSDRRFVQALAVIRAEAWLRGETSATAGCIEVGAHIFWDRPADSGKVEGLCYKVSNPYIFKALKMLESAEEAAGKILEAVGKDTEGDDFHKEAIQVSAQLKRIAAELDELAGKKGGKITDMATKVREIHREVVKRGVGLDV